MGGGALWLRTLITFTSLIRTVVLWAKTGSERDVALASRDSATMHIDVLDSNRFTVDRQRTSPTHSQKIVSWQFDRLSPNVVLASESIDCRGEVHCARCIDVIDASIIIPPTPIGNEGIMFPGRPAVRCPSVNTYFAWYDISLLPVGISVKLAINIHHVSGNCGVAKVRGQQWRSYCVQMYEWRRHTFRQCGVEAHFLF